MTNHEIKKPTLFISHATSDSEFAEAVKQEIHKVFANGINVFSTSSPGAIPTGNDWLNDIENRLNTAQAIIAIITPVSIERPWLWFEIGATWLNGRKGDCRIYPLCVQEINLSELPEPLSRLQALSLGRATDLKLLFDALIKQFGFGNIASFRATNVTKRIPKYKNVKVKDVDLGERAFYSGKYTGYSDEELEEIIDTELFYSHDSTPIELTWPSSVLGREDEIRLGKLLHFRQVDKDLELPPGTAKRLLVTVAGRYNLVPYQLTENVVGFQGAESTKKRSKR
jgi:TIR domain-containing protein